ncbi:hypothetical protein [Rhodoferax sp. PAMC 29310]|uniref:hypothetical protein n=1 Tax=Rhodoferax sp. PAMC 29310 TaxID=2822760 RepID=UPI001F0A8DEC|nr:hypothetical protein [Rhodoferax sp. PAMC 29310]
MDAVATGSAERDVTQDLKGALTTATPTHFSAITEPKQAGELMRSIFDYNGHPYTVAALKLPPTAVCALRRTSQSRMDRD